MAAVTRLARSSFYSSIARSRLLSTAAVPETLKNSQLYAQNPLLPRVDPKERNFQWVFLGCPGVGKGTFASRLCKVLGVPHIATGDLLREELASGSSLSKQVTVV